MILRSMLKSENNSSENREWLVKVENFRRIIKNNSNLKEMSKESIDNISYALKYLNYVTVQLNELVLDDVLKKMLYKSYYIYGTSIIEVILKETLKDVVRKPSNHSLFDLINEYKNQNRDTFNLSEDDLISRLHEIREKRNRIHLNVEDLDWNYYKKEDIILVSKVLQKVLEESSDINYEELNFLRID